VDAIEPVADSPPPRPDLRLTLRIGWIAARLIAVFYLGREGVLFFYQGF